MRVIFKLIAYLKNKQYIMSKTVKNIISSTFHITLVHTVSLADCPPVRFFVPTRTFFPVITAGIVYHSQIKWNLSEKERKTTRRWEINWKS